MTTKQTMTPRDFFISQVAVPAMDEAEEAFIANIEYQGNVLRQRLIDARNLLNSHGFEVKLGAQTK